MILERDDFYLLQAVTKSRKKGKKAKPRKNVKNWYIDDDEDDPTTPRKQTQVNINTTDNDDEKYRGEESGGPVQVKKYGFGSMGDVMDANKLAEIAREAEGDRANQDSPMKSFAGIEGTDDAERDWYERLLRVTNKGQGTGSSDLDGVIYDLMRPKVNWKAELRNFVAKIFGKTKYKIPRRRLVYQEVYTWGIKQKKTDYKNVVIGVDTSGSIGQEELNKFGTEIKKILEERGTENLYILYCDAEVKNEEHYRKSTDFEIRKMEPKGGGGTSFFPVFEWVYKNVPNPAFVLYFTDSFGDAPEPSNKIVSSYKDRVMWVITDMKDKNQASHLKFGKKILIDKKDFE